MRIGHVGWSLGVFWCVVSAAAAEEIAGIARVIDGDTLVMAGRIVRLEGIDAPEIGQTCEDRAGRSHHCGRWTRDRLADLADGVEMICRGETIDAYGRLLGTCAVSSTEINGLLVREGLAWAFVKYSRTYVAEEDAARAKGLGIWGGTAEAPWDYRAHRWDAAKQEAPSGCPIKGNITRSGERIYHLPWSPWYGKTTVNEKQGERWFCDEGQAIAAGWRPAHWIKGR